MYCIVLSLIQGYFKSSCGDVSRHTGLGTSAASPPRMGRHSHPVRSDPKWIQSNKVKWQVKWPVKWHERLPQSSLSISSFWMISGIAWAKWAKNQIFRWYRDSAAGGCLQGCATKVGVKLLGTMMDNDCWLLLRCYITWSTLAKALPMKPKPAPTSAIPKKTHGILMGYPWAASQFLKCQSHWWSQARPSFRELDDPFTSWSLIRKI